MRHIQILFILGLILVCTWLPAAEMRQWTGSNGKIIEAEFLGLDGDIVKLKLKNGREMNVLLSKFADKDQEIIKQVTSTEDPFNEEQTIEAANDKSYGRDVLRVSLNIAASGAGVLRLEKANTPLDHSNWGELLPSKKLPKTEIRKQKAEVKMCFDYRDPDPIEAFFPDFKNDGYKGISIDEKKKLLVFDHEKGNKSVLFRWPGWGLNPPLDLVCDIAEFSDECFSLEMTCNENGKNRSKVSIRVFCSGNSVGDKFDILFRYADRNEDQNGKPRFRELCQKKGIAIDKPVSIDFQIPQKYMGPFIFWIGKNIMLDSNEEQKLHSLGIIRYEMTGYLKIDDLLKK